MQKKSSEIIKENTVEKQSFFEKLKDKKYKAKLELSMGFGLIIILLVYANISGVGNNYDYNYNTTTNQTGSTTQEEKTFILDNITDNYSYNIDITLSRAESMMNIEEETNLVEYHYIYQGKRNKNNTIINKLVENNTNTYYKVDNEFYTKDAENYIPEKEENIYDLIEEKYLLLENIKEYINLASLDHTTTYSNGFVSYVYVLKVKDILKNSTQDDSIKIEVDLENEIPTITIDYTPLLNQLDSTINECKVTVKYTDVNVVEKFTIIEKEDES